MLDEQSGELQSGAKMANQDNYNHQGKEFVAGMGASVGEYQVNKGGASRFFYCAKASKSERNAGCEDMEEKVADAMVANEGKTIDLGGASLKGEHKQIQPKGNFHPTIKPLKLMEYLCTLTKTPTGGIVLDPFAGSFTTGVACINVDRDFIGIEREEEYCEIGRARIKKALSDRNCKDNQSKIF